MATPSLVSNLEKMHSQAMSEWPAIVTLESLEQWSQAYLGRNGQLAVISASLKDVPAEEKAEVGKLLNKIKQELLQARQQKEDSIKDSQNKLDLTIPAQTPHSGHIHVTNQTIEEIVAIFGLLGMHFVDAPEIDYDWFVFESLNMPKTHPARDDWETFFIDLPEDKKLGKVVLRPHTTNFELHVMNEQKPPIRAITVGKTYRRQADASHTPMFHQFEGLVIDTNLSIGNLVATLEYFVHNFFGPDVKTRLRPYHFRFTEPSFEVDISCSICKGEGCKLCKEGWLELGGAGMTHPSVIRNGGLDPDEFSGYAWGFGVERCLAIRYGINDLRLIYENDIRFLEQF